VVPHLGEEEKGEGGSRRRKVVEGKAIEQQAKWT
jgi:hypothetical protein